MIDNSDIVKFLKWLDYKTYNICYLPHGGGMVGKSLSDIDDIISYIKESENKAIAFYVNVQKPLDKHLPDKKLTALDMDRYSKIFIDLDPPKPTEKSNKHADDNQEYKKIVTPFVFNLLKSFNISPYVINSGNGSYFLFKCDMPNNNDSKNLITRLYDFINTKLVENNFSWQVDQKCKDISRICGIPGTINAVKTPSKPRKIIFDEIENEKVWTFEELKDLLDKVHPIKIFTVKQHKDIISFSPSNTKGTDSDTKLFWKLLWEKYDNSISGLRQAMLDAGYNVLGEDHEGVFIESPYIDNYSTPSGNKDVKVYLSYAVSTLHNSDEGKYWNNAQEFVEKNLHDLWNYYTQERDKNIERREAKSIKTAELQKQVTVDIAESFEEDDDDSIDLSTITPMAVKWIWDQRIPEANLTGFFGDGGSGKSTLGCHIASTVSNGLNWFDGSPCQKGTVLMISGEDNLQETLVPRLMACGANLNKVRSIQNITVKKNGKTEYDKKGKKIQKNFTLRDMPSLERVAKKYKDLKLVIIDPIGSYMDKSNGNDEVEVRELLSNNLQKFAKEYNVAVIIIGHTNKSKGGNARSKIMGASAYVNIPRSVFYMGVDPNNISENGFVLTHAKTNGSAITPSISYQFEIVNLKDANGNDIIDPTTNYPITCSRVKWTGISNLTADEIMVATTSVNTASNEAVELLQYILRDGKTRYAKDVIKQCEDKGISQATVYRSLEKAGVKKIASKEFQGKSTWQIPLEKQSSPDEDLSFEKPIQNQGFTNYEKLF